MHPLKLTFIIKKFAAWYRFTEDLIFGIVIATFEAACGSVDNKYERKLNN